MNTWVSASHGYVCASVWPEHRLYRYCKPVVVDGDERPARFELMHRLVVADSLGRRLESHEAVHHIDGDRTNNTLENLQLVNRFHPAGQVHRCRACGSHDIERVKIDE